MIGCSDAELETLFRRSLEETAEIRNGIVERDEFWQFVRQSRIPGRIDLPDLLQLRFIFRAQLSFECLQFFLELCQLRLKQRARQGARRLRFFLQPRFGFAQDRAGLPKQFRDRWWY